MGYRQGDYYPDGSRQLYHELCAAHSAFVNTRSVSDVEDALICDGGATCTLTKTLENCTQCKPKVVDIQTAQGATLMSTTHLCLKTYYVRDRLGEIRPIVVKAYVVPGPESRLK